MSVIRAGKAVYIFCCLGSNLKERTARSHFFCINLSILQLQRQGRAVQERNRVPSAGQVAGFLASYGRSNHPLAWPRAGIKPLPSFFCLSSVSDRPIDMIDPPCNQGTQRNRSPNAQCLQPACMAVVAVLVPDTCILQPAVLLERLMTAAP